MLYLVAIPPLILLLIVLTWQWFSNQVRELVRGMRVRRRVREGSCTPEKFIEETRSAFQDQGLNLDVVMVPNAALDLHDRVRERIIGQSDRPNLPAAIVMVLAADVNAGKLYLRAADTPAGTAGREVAGFHDFAQVANIDRESDTGDFDGVAAASEEYLAIKIADTDPQHYRLAIEPAWHTEPKDLVALVNHIVRDREAPTATPVIVR